ncbi:SDR family oxidoreductase, partial [Actinoplanes couchii]
MTGAARGQGAAEAAALRAEGATVIATDVLAADGVRPLDVRSLDQWTALARFLEETYGRVDAVINNAGVTGRDRLPDIDLDTWETTLAINLTGPMLSMKTLVPLMPRGFGTV